MKVTITYGYDTDTGEFYAPGEHACMGIMSVRSADGLEWEISNAHGLGVVVKGDFTDDESQALAKMALCGTVDVIHALNQESHHKPKDRRR
jgi:hypothetical protein